MIKFVYLLGLLAYFVSAQCPFASQQLPVGATCERKLGARPMGNNKAQVCYDAVKADLKTLMTDSKDFWPADFGHYGGLFIRLAWHCAGSHRDSDGRGGCDGANIRFNPEHSWMDNTNLDKALLLLEPIKIKYGNGLSWGDLIILAGNVAIESMGGPILGFCGGRVDNKDGSSSLVLGPTPEQAALYPCVKDGECDLPFGPTTLGLIYVNPGGHLGDGNPSGKILYDIRRTFYNMGMSDKTIVALIGGGHAFGKAHGACPTGPGPNPIQSPGNPWPGTCGSGPMKGKGPNTVTSGFEGPWTTIPTTWSNQYFQNLLNFNWTSHIGSGGNLQWRSSQIPGLMMLTSDIALIKDPVFLQYVRLFANNLTALNEEFAYGWYKLTTADMGPVTRCRGRDVPPAQDFQLPLPPTPAKLADFDKVKQQIKAKLNNKDRVSQVVHLAYQCISPFRITDYAGGCNGARIRFPPQNQWKGNENTTVVINFLSQFITSGLSYADLIVLAGQAGLEKLGAAGLVFKGGRTDASSGWGMAKFAPRTNWTTDIVLKVRDDMQIMGLAIDYFVALAGRPRSNKQQVASGYSGTYSDKAEEFSNTYFVTLLENTWEKVGNEYKAVGKDGVWMMATDMALLWDMEFRAVVQQFAADEVYFKTVFAAAWNQLAIADSFGRGTQY